MLHTHVPAISLVIVFILIRFPPSSLMRYDCVFVLIHFQERVQINAFLFICIVYFDAFSPSVHTSTLRVFTENASLRRLGARANLHWP